MGGSGGEGYCEKAGGRTPATFVGECQRCVVTRRVGARDGADRWGPTEERGPGLAWIAVTAAAQVERGDGVSAGAIGPSGRAMGLVRAPTSRVTPCGASSRAWTAVAVLTGPPRRRWVECPQRSGVGVGSDEVGGCVEKLKRGARTSHLKRSFKSTSRDLTRSALAHAEPAAVSCLPILYSMPCETAPTATTTVAAETTSTSAPVSATIRLALHGTPLALVTSPAHRAAFRTAQPTKTTQARRRSACASIKHRAATASTPTNAVTPLA